MAAFKMSALFLTLALLATGCLAKEHVLTLTADNFEEEVKKTDFIVVEFYAPWCGHCKSLAPEYEKAAAALAGEKSEVVLAKVDADDSKNKPLAQRFGVQGFPTLKIFRKGDLENPQDYKGPREADGIVSFVKKLSGPPSQELTSSAEIADTLAADKVLVVGVFEDLASEAFKTFTKVADAMRSDFSFRHTTDASLLPEDHSKLDAVPSVRVLKSFDEGFADSSVFEEAALASFIKSNSMPLVIEFSQDPENRPFLTRAFESKSKKVMLFYAYDAENGAEFKSTFTEVAKTRPDDITFISGETSANDHALKYFGIDSKEAPCIVLHDPVSNSKYYRTTIQPKDVSDFVSAYLAGTEEKKLKSEPLPEKNDGPVKVLVGKNFQEIVLDSKKNVLIEFYAPWCGHCQKLEPIYNQVGKIFSTDPDVIIAKMDNTANDLPTDIFPVEGFPTLYFYTSKGEVIPYKGDRSKNDIVGFVKQQMELLALNASKAEPEEAELESAAAEAAAETGAAAGKDEL